MVNWEIGKSEKTIRYLKLTDTITIFERKDGYWLYDDIRGMHLSMRAKTEHEAYAKAITFYQKRCEDIEQRKNKLYNSVNNFIESLSDNDEIEMPCDCEEY